MAGKIRPSIFNYGLCRLFSGFNLRPDRLDLRGAEFEFRNLAEWIERRIRQNICRRFHKRERDEHDAIRNGIVLTRVELDGATSRRHTDHVAGPDAKLCNGAT